MKRFLAMGSSIMLIISMLLVLTGCGDNKLSDNLNTNIDQIKSIEYDKIIKVELRKQGEQLHEKYDYYAYYYFQNDKLITEDRVYIFDSITQAQQWYDAHVQALQDKNVSKLDGNKVIDNEPNSQYINWEYADMLDFIKNSIDTISYTQE